MTGMKEFGRWLIFLPLLVLSQVAFAVVLRFLDFGNGYSGALTEISFAAMMAYAFFGVSFALAPRAQIPIAWAFLVVMMLVWGSNAVVVALHGFGIEVIPNNRGAEWRPADTLELVRSTFWCVSAPFAFAHFRRQHLENFREPEFRVKPAAAPVFAMVTGNGGSAWAALDDAAKVRAIASLDKRHQEELAKILTAKKRKTASTSAQQE